MYAHPSSISRTAQSRRPTRPSVIEHAAAPAGLQRAILDPARATPAEMLNIQRTLGNRAANRLVQTGRTAPVIQRLLDENFKHGGEPIDEEELENCKAFAQKVSDIVDQAYEELITGQIGEWNGKKIATFLNLLQKYDEPKTVATAWAGNAVEERVYALMKKTNMGLPWTPQFTEGMGGVSFPDIVINLDTDREALVDVTSDRQHILRKGGAWTKSKRYVYVAEAYFPSVTEDDLPNIKAALKEGGIGLKQAKALKKAADEERKRRAEEWFQKVTEERQRYNQYASFSKFVREEFDGDKTAAAHHMREHGLGSLKGVPKLKGKRKPSEDTRKKYRRRARKEKQAKQKQLESALAQELLKNPNSEAAKKVAKSLSPAALAKLKLKLGLGENK